MSNFSDEKIYTYIKGFAMGANMDNTIKALAYARDKHLGQNRKSGEPYIIHPLTLASHALALGVKDDNIIAAMLLHDVVEDCNVTTSSLPVNDTIKSVVALVTYVKPLRVDGQSNEEYKIKIETVKERYYEELSNNKEASIVKIFDRCHNVSTMVGAFTHEKIESYIDETKVYILPLIRNTKDRWPELSDLLFVLKYHIHSVIDALELMYMGQSNK